jgi:DNA-binding NtrC family response regulator
LRERIEDLPSLVDYFVEKYNQELVGQVEGVAPEAMRALMAYSWPGNIRELENVIKRGIVLVGEGSICPEHLPPEIRQTTMKERGKPPDGLLPPPPEPANSTLEGMERAQIGWALAKAQGNQSQAARLLGISREKLRYRLRKYSLER